MTDSTSRLLRHDEAYRRYRDLRDRHFRTDRSGVPNALHDPDVTLNEILELYAEVDRLHQAWIEASARSADLPASIRHWGPFWRDGCPPHQTVRRL
ncbi:MAG: hypothetical protein GEU28_13020 [Dehalococcoidia bacterium]|nr:hypothetical protein [Dehalococcoidia bacterium]